MMKLKEISASILVLFFHGCIIASAARDVQSSQRRWLADNHVPDETSAGIRMSAQAQHSKPNIVFILTDDQDVTMDAISPMTNTLNMLGKQGMTFTNMFTSSPLCCPSRSSILTGNYIHNHGAMNNSIQGNCSSVAWQQGPEKKTFATYLNKAGYRTFFAGKYLNQYGQKEVGGLAHIPPGWDDWIALKLNSVYYNYSLSVNGKEEVHGDDYHKDYLTDLINNRSMEFLQKQSVSSPFFMMMSTPACHSPFDSAPQYMSHFTDKKAPRGPSFNVHSADKHWLIRRAANPMSNASITYLDDSFRKRWRTLLSVDDMVKNLVTLLTTKKMIDNTYIIFSSDNGFHLGQFSLPNDKRQLYEFDIRVPLIIRGPGISPGTTSKQIAVNIDIMPTIVEMATGSAPSEVDGISLMPLLIARNESMAWRETVLIEHRGEGNTTNNPGCKDTVNLCIPPNTTNEITTVPWRQEILIEHTGEWKATGYRGCPHTEFLDTCYPSCVCEDARNNTYTCVRTSTSQESYVYCNFADNENFQEFYNVTADPHQLTNTIHKLDPKFITSQNEKLIVLSMCKGPSCRQLIPPPPSPSSKHGNSIDGA
ncbi:N-acetylglucosamine-6-sulfatase isoform X2 [Strongylocentrotus purpuratus]|uniref:Sulfatase N-terminal domain-containing protein n=1 Tax=Strongylocentrotus purpuratus TaxID=7668 RepID=A0A7M7MX85_STRPU|nr:N-acetylglucosamine-6-sulfatase isoform X2 [Strongylocentrotus purpuratus]